MIGRATLTLRALAVAAALGAAAGGAALADRSRPADREEVRAYAEAIAPLAREGGRIAVLGIRQGLGALVFGDVGPEEFRRQAAGWRQGMSRVRESFAAVPAPGSLAAVAAEFDRALATYLRAIDAFVEASRAPRDAIPDAIEAAVPIAEEADRIYDRASAMLDAERRRVGLPVDEEPSG